MRVAMIGAFGFSPRMTMRARALPMAEALVARGHDVLMIMPPWHTPQEAAREWTQDGVQIKYVSLGPRVPGMSQAATAWRLVQGAMAFNPDIIHIFKPKAFAGAAAWLLWHIKRLHRSHAALIIDQDDWEGPGGWNDTLSYPPLLGSFFTRQERWALRHADAVTVASNTLQSLVWAQGVPQEQVYHLPNGARPRPLGNGTRIRAKYDMADQPIVLLYTRFFEYDSRRIVKVFQHIHQAIPKARLLVVGQALFAEDQIRFSQALEQAKLTECVIQAGWVDERDLPDYFAAADIALYPFDDTLINRTKCPVKLVDLLQAGVPVVADAVGEIREYIGHGEAGLLVAYSDPDEMAAAAIDLLADPQRRCDLGMRAAKRIRAHYGWDILTEKLLRIYQSV